MPPPPVAINVPGEVLYIDCDPILIPAVKIPFTIIAVGSVFTVPNEPPVTAQYIEVDAVRLQGYTFELLFLWKPLRYTISS